jgi:hypothetical protein
MSRWYAPEASRVRRTDARSPIAALTSFDARSIVRAES